MFQMMMLGAEMGEVCEFSSAAVLPISGVVNVAAYGSARAPREPAGLIGDVQSELEVCRRPVVVAADREGRSCLWMRENPHERGRVLT